MRGRLPNLRLMALLMGVLAAQLHAQDAQPAGGAPSWLTSWMQGVALFVPHLGVWSGSAGLGFSHGEQTTSSSATGSASKNNNLAETVSLSNSGIYVLSPLLFTGSMGLSLNLNQSKSSGSGEGTGSVGKGLGYNFSGTFLGSKPYPVDLSAYRNQIRLTQSSGTRVVGTNENRRINFSLLPNSVLNDMGYSWTEGALELSQQHEQSTSESFGRSFITDQKAKSFNFLAHKGFETADLGFKYNSNEQQNVALGLDAVRSNYADLSYSLDFGPTLNLKLESNLNYQAQSGAPSSDTLSANANLQWAHKQSLNSRYAYSVTQQSSGQTRSKAQSLSAGVSHQLYKNLNTSLQVSTNHAQMAGGTTRSLAGQFGQTYTHSIPGGGSLSTSWSAGHQIDRNALVSGDIKVINEPHTAPAPLAFGQGFDLNQRFVVRSTVAVRNGSGTLMMEGSDYVVVDSWVDSRKTRVEPLPTSLTLAAGDALLVDYVYQVDPTLSSRTQSRSFGMGLSYPWGNLAFGRSSSQAMPVDLSEKSANSPFLQSSAQRFVQLGTNYDLWGMAASTSVNYSISESVSERNNQLNISGDLTRSLNNDTQATIAWRVNQERYQLPTVRSTRALGVQGAYRQPGRSLTLSVNARNSTYTAPDAYTDRSLTTNGTYNWYSEGGWNNALGIELSRQQQRTTPAQLLLQIRGQSSVTLGRLSLSVNGAYGQWRNGSQRSVNKSFNVAATRSF